MTYKDDNKNTNEKNTPSDKKESCWYHIGHVPGENHHTIIKLNPTVGKYLRCKVNNTNFFMIPPCILISEEDATMLFLKGIELKKLTEKETDTIH